MSKKVWSQPTGTDSCRVKDSPRNVFFLKDLKIPEW